MNNLVPVLELDGCDRLWYSGVGLKGTLNSNPINRMVVIYTLA